MQKRKFNPLYWLRRLAVLIMVAVCGLARWTGKALLASIVIAAVGVIVTQRYRYANLEEAKHLQYHATLKGTGLGFDIPVTYYHSGYLRNQRRWPRPSHAREEVDYITIDALLPDLEPYTETNAAEFETPGWGRKIKASMTHLPRGDWAYYFKNFAYRLERLPDSPEVPGMLHYQDTLTKHEIFLSHDRPAPNLIFINCRDTTNRPFPSCDVQTLYRNRFYFKYTFGRSFLSQWREIDCKLKALFDHFAQPTLKTAFLF
jgi:hypothetical protein